MSQRLPKVLFNSLVLALLAASAFGLAVKEEFQQTYDLAAGGRISLENVNGNVDIEGWDRDEVQVDYVKSARTQAGLERMEVKIDATGRGIDISTEYARRQNMDSGYDGGSVDFVLYVPRDARLEEIELVNGNLVLRQLDGDVAVEVVNGKVNADGLGGRVEISSVNGSMDIGFDSLSDGQRVELESVNGSLQLSLPDDANADIEAETVQGAIKNDFGWEVKKGRYVGRSMSGTLGRGGARVELENVNGSIAIRSR